MSKNIGKFSQNRASSLSCGLQEKYSAFRKFMKLQLSHYFICPCLEEINFSMEKLRIA